MVPAKFAPDIALNVMLQEEMKTSFAFMDVLATTFQNPDHGLRLPCCLLFGLAGSLQLPGHASMLKCCLVV